jgi:hypothetical protein
MSEKIYLATIVLFLGTILLVFGMRYVSVIVQARARQANDDAYRLLAQKAVDIEVQNATTLASVHTALSDVRIRLTAIEKVLKEVE